MAYKLDMIGQTYGPFIRKHDCRETKLFGLSCAAAFDGKTDLEYVYEKNLKLLPIYYAMPIVDTEVTKTVDWGFDDTACPHYGFDFRVIKPLDPMKTTTLKTMVTLKGLYDRGEGKGTIGHHYGETYDEEGTLLFTNDSYDIDLNGGGWGGPKAPKDIVDYPDRVPDFEFTDEVPLNMHVIHRLFGGVHPLHVDWEVAKAHGYPSPFIHAISTAGIACRNIIRAVCPGEPERLTRFKTRITRTMFVGATMITQIWKMDDGSIRFRCIDAKDHDYIYLNFALAEFK